MPNQRRYNDEEIEAIFKVAAEAQEAAHQRLPHNEGLTLKELQDIGGDAGITPEFIAHAVASLSVPEASRAAADSERPGTFLGVPYRVQRTVELPRPLTDDEWERLVVDCRLTFAARGTVESHGALREWRNGNLYVLLEPGASGQRLRMGSTRAASQTTLSGAVGLAIVTILFMIMFATTGELPVLKNLFLLSALGAGALGMAGWTALRSPMWARERESQMDGLATRTADMIEARVSKESESAPTSASRSTEPPDSGGRIEIEDKDVRGGEAQTLASRQATGER